jgi:hypothetical protein
LTGIDWIIGSLNRDARENGGAGAVSQVILALDGRLNEKTLGSALETAGKRFPLIQGRVARDWLNLAPYWKVPRSFRPESIRRRVIELPPEASGEADRLFAEHVNTPLESESQHLSFLLIGMGQERSRLGMVFDHRLFDAYGAEAFLGLIDLAWQGRLEEIAPQVRQTEPAHLDHWGRRFQSGKALGDFLKGLKNKSIGALAPPAAGVPRRVAFIHERLSPEQTVQFIRKAGEEIGVPILLPSAASRAVMALRHVLPSMPLAGAQYLVFTTVNTRTPGREWESLFFNPFSFIPFTADHEPPASVSEMAVGMRGQFFQLMKQGIPAAMQDATALGRICPLWLASKIMQGIGQGRMCTMYFTCLRDSGFPGNSFLGLPVENLIHTPMAFTPPGMNLCMTYFHHSFNIVLSYVEGALSDSAARAILEQFKASLL